MKQTLLVFLCLFLSSTVLPKTTHAPLPDKILKAKNVFIDNRSGLADIGDRCYDELQKWGRFVLVKSAKEADIVFLLTTSTYNAGTYTTGHMDDYGNYSGSSRQVKRGVTHLYVIDPVDGSIAWENSRDWGRFKSATREMVKDLRKRMEEKQ